MVEKNVSLRRSRRAASLTAQALWNIQIEEDLLIRNKSNSKPSLTEACQPQQTSVTQTKPGRKRKVEKVPNTSRPNEKKDGKKQKVAAQCSTLAFSDRKPLHLGKVSTTNGKLTASVAPWWKPQPTLPKTVQSTATTVTNVASHSPILLLPVSLQANQVVGGGRSQNVGNLQLVTLQAPPGFLNCLNLNKTIVNTAESSNRWNSMTTNCFNRVSVPAQSNIKQTSTSYISNKVNASVQTLIGTGKCQAVGESVKVQLEPLNLKVGETTIAHSVSTVLTKPTMVSRVKPLAPTTVSYPRIASKSKPQSLVSSKRGSSSNADTKCKKLVPIVQLNQILKAAAQRQKNNKNAPVSFRKNKQTHSVLPTEKKRQLKSPSPDYACSSPDVDDVVRNPRHTCNKKHINLRNKAAPAPGTREYDRFVEEQRRLLAAIKKRTQRAKASEKAKSELKKKTKPKKKSAEEDNDNRSLSMPETFKLQTHDESNHGWKWWGKPYSSMVYSMEHGKYVMRKCYPAMIRKDEETESTDVILVRDCVFLLAGEEDELSYVAKVCALWENPNNQEMFMSVVWYYRPEQIEDGKKRETCEDELFASKHQDNISVACVEQRCKILTFSRFSRMHAKLNNDGRWRSDDLHRVIPPAPNKVVGYRPLFSDEEALDPQDMFYSRYLYDVHSRKVRYKLPQLVSLSPEHAKRGSTNTVTT